MSWPREPAQVRRIVVAMALATASITTGSMASRVRAAQRPTTMTKIADHGVTRVEAINRGGPLLITLTTRSASQEESVAEHASRCSGGRVVCSLVDKLEISIAGKQIDVPRQVVLLLADVNSGRVQELSAGRFEAVLNCGDAAAAYDIRIFFDRHRVTRTQLWASEAGMLEQVTTYYDTSHAFQ